MADDHKLEANADRVSVPSARPSEGVPSGSGAPEKSAPSRRAMSISALAAAVAAIGLPLIRIRSAEAATAYCASDSYQGFDVGDPGDCPDCTYAAIPSDCTLEDSTGGTHTSSGDYLPPSDSGGDGGSCGDCGGCGGGGDYYGS